MSEVFNPIETVEFIYSQKCNIKCDHCITEASPDGNSKLDCNKVLSVVRKLPDFGVGSVGFTGGEPLLYLDEMLEIISAARSFGVKPNLISNGFWGSSVERAELMVSKLVSAGLNCLNVSTDEFHLKFIPDRNVLNIFDAARKKNLKVILRFASTKNYSFFDFVAKHKDYLNKINPKEKPFLLFSQFLTPFGRAFTNVPKENYCSSKKSIKGKCIYLGRPTINYDKRLFVCCHYFEKDNNAFNVGNLNLDSPGELLGSYRKNLFVFFQRHKGPYFIAKLAEKHKLKKVFKTKKLLDKYIDLCDYCKLNLSQYSKKDVDGMLLMEFERDKGLQGIAGKEFIKFKKQVAEKKKELNKLAEKHAKGAVQKPIKVKAITELDFAENKKN